MRLAFCVQENLFCNQKRLIKKFVTTLVLTPRLQSISLGLTTTNPNSHTREIGTHSGRIQEKHFSPECHGTISGTPAQHCFCWP